MRASFLHVHCPLRCLFDYRSMSRDADVLLFSATTSCECVETTGVQPLSAPLLLSYLLYLISWIRRCETEQTQSMYGQWKRRLLHRAKFKDSYSILGASRRCDTSYEFRLDVIFWSIPWQSVFLVLFLILLCHYNSNCNNGHHQ